MELQVQKVAVLLCLLVGLYTAIVYILPKGEAQAQPKPARWSYDSKRRKAHVELVQKDTNYMKAFHLPITTGLNDVISEKEALKFKPCADSKLAANTNTSMLKLIGDHHGTYRLGDTITVQTTMYDAYGQAKTTGGDNIRGRMSSPDLRAYAPGTVKDHNNGTYSIIFEALWSGEAYITVTIAYTREAITAMYRLHLTQISLKLILTKFQTGNIQEDVICHPDENLTAYTKYKDVCNFTQLNSGMPWYCGKPHNPKLSCSHWTKVRHVLPTWPKSISKCEKELLAFRAHKDLFKKIKVLVTKPAQLKNKKSVAFLQSTTSCQIYNTSKLWFRKTTTGYFFKGQWKMQHCKGFHRAYFDNCLRNRKLYLIGDSTTRQWYEDILKRYNCIQFTEQWKYAKWKKPSGCTVARNNFTVALSTHCQPFYVGTFWIDPKFTFNSISKQIDSISSHEDVIVLIHIFLHMNTFHHKHFRYKMRAIRNSVEKLIQRNEKAKVFIKMPHTYSSVHQDNGAINDFSGYIYSGIIVEEFRGLYDKVTVLDNKDATIAVASGGLHPLPYIVSAMVDQMFSYICG
ncbi:NXPE family member 3-like [Ruditapes philippinarum]|uniref:NXPE family member 3-like n=1 Tax=Ruditapes philippinarum TaxID=129788 RepID=UPI00295C0911|nr:NXPE family member 3-like [Ruditapes philippinarum]